MKNRTHPPRRKETRFVGFFLALLAWALIPSLAQALTLNVQGVDTDGNPVADIGTFRWLVQEDTTYDHEPGVQTGDILATGFHRSYMPVLLKGDSTQTTIDLPADKRYFVSVLPDAGFAMGGAPVAVGQNDVTVTVNAEPIPTAQITVFVFHDNSPINNAPDTPQENGLAGWDVVLYDGGGRYGASGGQMMLDAFSNPLGTTYDAAGNVLTMGNGIKTGPDGYVTIKNLAPGKYGVQVVPPAGEGWIQTATIEGTKTIDAWVKANEPTFFTEFGPPGPHVFIGFVQPFDMIASLPNPSGNVGTLSGQVVNSHMTRPPEVGFFNGAPVPGCWVGLNDLATGGTGVYAAPCDAESNFTIDNVPPGSYQLAIWDRNLDYIFGLLNVTVPPEGGQVDIDMDGDPAVNQLPVFRWFGTLENTVFYDADQDGFRDCVTAGCNSLAAGDEVGILEQAINLRFRDGSLYLSMPTDMMGEAPFEEVFPFFNWLVAEVDFARFKATGATVVVDAGGGPVPPGEALVPQQQAAINPNTGDNLSRTETGEVLTQGFQLFLGQTSKIQWGKAAYGPGENGGISGIVYYATTRAEDDPRYAAAEPWEPGIPRVQVALYQDADWDGNIDDLNGDGLTLADVDNYPFDWTQPAPGMAPTRGPEDIDRDDPDPATVETDAVFSAGDAIQISTTDSWDDNLPTGCPGDPFTLHGVDTDCYDGLRNFNQIRPGVFDGGYAFSSYFPGGMLSGSAEVDGLPAGTYIVEATVPPGYELLKEEDRNVDFGDEYAPAPELLPPVCTNWADEDGDGIPGHLVPAELSLFPGVPASFAGENRPLCDQKQVILTDSKNAAADFFLFTEVPIAGQFTGFILDDLANEFNPNSPTFGEKFAPPWLPVSIRDWTGQEVSRVYSDEFGNYNGLVPSTFTVNLPHPSGVSPSMMTLCMNSPGPILDTRPDSPTFGQMITDPFFDRQYSQFCYTFQFMPGTTTYLDTPVVPVAAHAGPDQFPMDCNFGDGTPVIWSANGPQGGPYVQPGDVISIASAGSVEVDNPAYDGAGGVEPATITRDFGFGSIPGSVTINGVSLTNVSWAADGGSISGVVPQGATSGQLTITRGDNGMSTVMGLTVTVAQPGDTYNVIQVSPDPAVGATPIQDAIDLAQPGDLILVAPGSYEELVIMWKEVRLQGYGAVSTTINAVKAPGEKLQAWRDRIQSIVDPTVGGDAAYLLPEQEIAFGGIEPVTFFTEEGPGIIVITRPGDYALTDGNARIDGLTVTGADHGGGIFVNAYADSLEISNNRVMSNHGIYGGGIRIGHPFLVNGTGDGYADGNNDNIRIHHNQIAENGGGGAAGGGLALCTGTDNYQVADNFICGNATVGDGGGIGHFGLSNNGRITGNTIIFNQSFTQGTDVAGGGILIAGVAGPGGTLLSQGAGNVVIDGNLLQGNYAGAGDGGGIRAEFVNGMDVAASPSDSAGWYSLGIFDNMIVNNVAGMAGGAISLQDTLKAAIINNTAANNDSTATAGLAFATPSVSTPQTAGIVAHGHSAALQDVIGAGAGPEFADFSNPLLVNNIVRHNRSFYWDVTANNGLGGLLPDPATPVYDDLGVDGAVGMLDPDYSILTDITLYDDGTNLAVDPLFVSEYVNGNPGVSQYVIPENPVPILTAPALDEGGNFIDVRFGPLTLLGDYHLQDVSPAIDSGDSAIVGSYAELEADFDGDARPMGAAADIGADETGSMIDICEGDFDLDQDVDLTDLIVFRSEYGRTDCSAASPCQADFDGDGDVDLTDFTVFRSDYGRTDCP